MDLLALSGSLRTGSYNSAVISALGELAPECIDMRIGDIGSLPLFNPDLEETKIPALDKLTHELSRSQGLIIASPEYDHGISGPMKNALDWLVSGAEFPGLHVMLINTSPRATHAQSSLKEIVKTMSGVVVENACVSVPLLGSNLDAHGIVTTQEIATALKTGLARFVETISGKCAKT